MAVHQLDADTAESVAGVVRLLRRAAVLAWVQVDAHGPGSPRQVLALGIDLAADEALNMLDRQVVVDGPVPVGTTRRVCCDRLSCCCAGSVWPVPRLHCTVCGPRWLSWCGRRTPVPDQQTAAVLVADSDALARDLLLDLSADRAPAMVRSWVEVVQAAARLWTVFSVVAARGPADMDIMDQLHALGAGIARSTLGGGWPGQGPLNEQLLGIGENLT